MNPLFLDWENFVVACSEEGEVIGCGQIRPLSDAGQMELASLVVDEAYRGKGVGTAIVTDLLDRKRPQGKRSVFCTTLARTSLFYERIGFRKVKNANDVPLALRLEIGVGTFIAALAAGDSLVLLRLDD